MIKVLIVDDHPIVLEGMKRMFETEADIQIVGTAQDGSDAMKQCQKAKPNVAIVDLVMPGMDGVEVTRMLGKAFPRTRVLILTMHDNEEYAVRVLRAGAAGFIPKGASAHELVHAVRKVHRGETYVSPAILEKIGAHIGRLRKGDAVTELTPRELEVLRKIADGKTVAQTAKEMHLSISTVHTHRYRMMERLGVKTNAALVRFALENGLVK